MISNALPARRRLLVRGVCTVALASALASAAGAATLQPNYTPAQNNFGGSNPGRVDIITLTGTTDTIGGAYGLGGTSARRFVPDSATIAERFASGDVVSGYNDVAGQSSVALTGTQKTAIALYPDAIQGTSVSTNVYDNAKLVAVDSTSTPTFNYTDTNAPVYADLRIANIAGSNVTIATGDKAASLYDRANFATQTADSGSTLYNVTAGSAITYDSKTASFSGESQNGLSQSGRQTIAAPVTTYSGVAFGNGDSVTDLASLRRYNTALIGQLTSGAITPQQYEGLIQAAAVTSTRNVVISQDAFAPYQAPATTSQRTFMRLDASRLVTTADSVLVGVGFENNFDGGTVLVRAQNGATIQNNGQIVTAAQAPAIVLTGAGTSLTSAATGVIGVGYETLDRSGGGLRPTGANSFFDGSATDQSAVVATGGATVLNRGIVNVANRDVPVAGLPATLGKANSGIVVGGGATASNEGTILIGGAASAAANQLGSYRGAAGMVALDGGTATNAAGGTIRVGSSFAENAADLAAVTDVQSVNYANGMTSIAGGGTLVNAGTIRIGGLAQNANGILVGGGSTATNAGTIAVDAATLATPVNRNTGITVLGRAAGATPGVAVPVDAINAADGRIDVRGVNSVGILVAGTVPGGTARAENLGTITIDGGLSADRLRNFALLVDGAGSSARQDGSVVLNGEGAIGVHARNAGAIDVGPNGTVRLNGVNQIGYYLLGAGSTIAFSPAAATTDVATTGSTGIRVEGGARLSGDGVNLVVGGQNATGIVASGASNGITVDTTGATIAVTGTGATGVRVEGGASGTLAGAIAVSGQDATGAIVDGQRRTLDGVAAGAADPTTRLASSATVTSAVGQTTGYVARNAGRLDHAGTIAMSGLGSTGILATTGATVTNSGAIDAGAGSTGIRLVSTGAGDVVTADSTGAITARGSGIATRGRGIQADGAGATGTFRAGGTLALAGDGAIGAEAVNGGTIDASAIAAPTFAAGTADQIAFRIIGPSSRILAAPGTLAVSGTRATGFRVEGGATRTFDAATAFSTSGIGATAIVATGTGTAITTAGTAFTVAGGSAVAVSGGATGTLDRATTIALTDIGTGASVDGRMRGLDNGIGAQVGATLDSAATVTGGGGSAYGYSATGGGTLNHSGTIALTGTSQTGIFAGGAGTSVANSGSVTLAGYGVGIAATEGARIVNTGTVTVANGTGIELNGPATSLTGNGAITSNGDIAALAVYGGGTVNTAANITAGGTASGVLLRFAPGSVTLGAGTITANGSGNGIENDAGSAVRLNGTSIVANGSGSGIRTAASLDPASTGTVTAAGAGSTAFTFAGTGNARIAGDLRLPAGLTLTATGTGANGLALNTSGNATLAGTIAVTGAAGGSALIGGPAASIANAGTLRSASLPAPVVDLSGGTGSFTNTGTIAAASPTAVAVRGGAVGQTVTLAGGAVTGIVRLGGGADSFVMSGGTLAGNVETGGGNDVATFRDLTDANLAGVTRIAGGGAATGNDRLVFDNTRSTGTQRLVGFNSVALTNGSTLTSDGNLALAGGGAFTVNRGTTYFAGGGVNAAIVGNVANAGTIDLTNGNGGAGDTLTVRGNYAGNGGTLRLDTVLNATGPSDRLVIDGGTVTGTTSIAINNTGGLGAQTTGNGIEIVSGINGASTTATTTRDGFTLAGGRIDVGAYEYRLFASDPQGTQSWYLRSESTTPPSSSDPSGNPPSTSNPSDQPTPPNVALRPEVALFSGFQQQLRHQDLDMLGTYHQRMGDAYGEVKDGISIPGRLWGRAIYDSYRIKNRNAGRSDFDGRAYGFQIGVDVLEVGTDTGRHQIGLYAGYLDGQASVRGFAGGRLDQYVGRTDPRTAYLAAYWTYQANSGFYVDTVVQHAWYNGKGRSASDNRFDIGGTGVLASVETGYAIPLSARFTIEPQAQLVAQGISLDDVTIPNATVAQKNPGTLTGRLGARLVGNVPVAGRTMQPYVRANLWKQFASTDRTTFYAGATRTQFDTRTSSLYGQAGAGLTYPIAANIAVFGEGDYRFTLDHGQGVTGHAVNGSIGIKARF